MDARWWDIRIRCRAGLADRALRRLRSVGLRGGCVVEVVGDDRVLRAFLPLGTSRDRIIHAALALEDDAQECGEPQPVVTFAKAETAESPYPWEPTAVGRRLLVQPADAPPPDDGRLVVRLVPRFGFGTTHETTRLCLEALEGLLRPGDVLADLGCGSGVLSIAAVRLGAARVDAFDLDPVAADTAEANRALNGIEADRMRVEAAGVEGLEASGTLYQGVLCNTSRRVLEQVTPRLGAITRSGGWLVATGFKEADVQPMSALLVESGWRIEAKSHHEEWYALVGRRAPGLPSQEGARS